MRKKPCLEGARPPRRGHARHWLTLSLAACLTAGFAFAQSGKGVLDDRQDRLERTQAQQETQQKAEAEPWSTAKIIINLDARCPVVTTLGFFGAFASGDEKDADKLALAQTRFTKLQAAVKPLAEELKKMAATNTFVGKAFPPALEPRLNVLCAELYGDVGKIYGDDSLAELKKYVATLAQGVVAR